MKTNSNKDVISLAYEEETRLKLIEYYKNSYGKHVTDQVNLLLALDGYIDRFNHLQSILGNQIQSLSSILISGYGAGSEMIVARNFGFQEVHGVEVIPSLLEATKVRLTDLPGMFPILYDGLHLPYNDEQYDLVASGHIIEHTQSPINYLSETMRVLKTGGFLYIEFPSRYHYIELHTGLFSFEWLPTSLRNLALQIMSSRFSFLNRQTKSKYKSILSTGLQQVSRHDILLWLKQMGIGYKEINYSKPAPGIVRCLIQKSHDI